MNQELELIHPESILDSEGKTSTVSKNLAYFVVLSMIFGIILILINFVNVEKILWNRVNYSTGSLWENAQPIYINEPLGILKQNLQSGFIGIIIGSIFAVISLGVLIFISIKPENRELLRRSIILLNLFCAGFIAFIGFWLEQSIAVIQTLESEKDGGLTGDQWINVEIGEISTQISALGRVLWIAFLIGFIIMGFPLIMDIIRVRQQKRAIRVLKMQPSQNSALQKTKTEKRFQNFIAGFLGNIPFYLILTIYLLFTLYPIYLTVKVSISTPFEIKEGITPQSGLYSMILNYSSVIFAESNQEGSFITAFKYSIFIGVGTGFIGLAVSLTAAYALARFKFGGNKFLTFLILTTQMFPGMILLIPQYLIWANLGLLEETPVIGDFDVVHFGLLLASAGGATAYCTWMMKGYFETIPVDIEEAALIDGSGRFSTFLKIAIPLAKSGIVAVLVFTFLTAWQEFILARTFIQNETKVTLPLLFYNYQDLNQPNAPVFYELLAPYAILVAFPIVLFFMILQKQLSAGAVAGGVK